MNHSLYNQMSLCFNSFSHIFECMLQKAAKFQEEPNWYVGLAFQTISKTLKANKFD